MAKDYPRSRRVAEQIQREMADIIRKEIHDPRVGMITVTEVVVTHDLEHAKIYFTVFESEARGLEAAKALGHASGFIRSQLGPRMRLRIVPQLTFVYDTSISRGAELSRIIDEAVAADAKRPADDAAS
ncbi:MAG: 30S ribosome-binding factor RbfA [Sulfuriferula sp.]|nr:30S ribosome-binding factor RbfA [Sulfuriferula sp.]